MTGTRQLLRLLCRLITNYCCQRLGCVVLALSFLSSLTSSAQQRHGPNRFAKCSDTDTLARRPTADHCSRCIWAIYSDYRSLILTCNVINILGSNLITFDKPSGWPDLSVCRAMVVRAPLGIGSHCDPGMSATMGLVGWSVSRL